MSRNLIKHVLIALSVIGFIAPALVDVMIDRPSKIDVEALRYLGAAFGFGMFAMTAWLEFHAIHKEFDTTKASLEASIRGRRDFVNEGDAQSAMKKIKERFERAINVSNVYMPYADRPNIYYQLCDDQRVGNINAFVARADVHRYTEIVGRDAYLNVSETYESKIIDPKQKFDLRVTSRVFPCMNFIIFEYPDSEREVMFGWGGYANLTTSEVYSTTEPDVVSMFQEIFSTLSGVSGYPSSDDSYIGTLRTCLGYWVDIAIRTDSRTRARCYTNAAILNFYMDSSRKFEDGESRLAVRGLAFEIAEAGELGKPVREFSSTSCELRDQKVYVSHRSSDPYGLRDQTECLGHSMYDFRQLASTGHMYGTVFSPVPIVNMSETSISVTARKLTKKEAARIDPVWGPRVQMPDLNALRDAVAPLVQRLIKSFPDASFASPRAERAAGPGSDDVA